MLIIITKNVKYKLYKITSFLCKINKETSNELDFLTC